MTFYYRRRGGKRLAKKPTPRGNSEVRLAALLLCLSLLAGFLPALASAEAGAEAARFFEVVKFDSITLHYAGAGGQPEAAAIQDGTLIEKDRQLALRYTYAITGEQCGNIKANTPYYLDVSPHLVLPHLEGGSPLTVETEEGTQEQFGMIYSNGASAWVIFDAQENSTDTVLSGYGELNNAYFYLDCARAADVPAGEDPIEGHSNLYAMKFESGEQLKFGYAENEPVSARAQITKGGSLTDKTITWTINYTPWQNPAEDDGVAPDTPFELRDTIDSSLHSYVPGSVKIDGQPVTNTSRDENAETYVLVETPVDSGDTTLTFGGTKFKAVQSTKGNPAEPLKITYDTTIKDELLLPGGAGGKTVTNAAELFAGPAFDNRLGISGTSLGSNVAWFTFDYNGSPYSTLKATTPVGSGNGSGQPGTSTLVKTNTGYRAATRTIDWTVTINPHKANLKSGTFTDDLSQIGPQCTKGHTRGLQLEGDIQVSMDGESSDNDLVKTSYENQQIKVEVGNVGATAITLTYTTKVCDPCVFANNTGKAAFKNTISTSNMVIGASGVGRSASADSTADVSTAVLTKKPPVYDYASGTMKWTVEVDAAGLSNTGLLAVVTLLAGSVLAAMTLCRIFVRKRRRKSKIQ